MATEELNLKPGDSVSLRLQLAGQVLRLDLRLSEEGIAQGSPPPAPVELPEEETGTIDLTDEFASDDVATEESVPAPEPVEAVDIPLGDLDDEPAEVIEESSSDLDLDFGEEEADIPADGSAAIDIPSDDKDDDYEIVEEEPVAAAPEEEPLLIEGDGFEADAQTMVPSDQAPADVPALDAISATLTPMKFHDPATDYGAGQAPPKKPAVKPGPSSDDTLPAWTGRARDYRDPEIEKKKATAKLDKRGITKRRQKPAAAADAGLSLAEEAPAAVGPAPAKKPAATGKTAARKKTSAKVLPKAKMPAKKQITKPIKPKTSQKKKAVSARQPAAGGGGAFTVFLSPPKGTTKRATAAEIIADVKGIDLDAANALAGKMIVPVVKGVSEGEAQSVRDRFKEAGLSCRITQKR